VETIEKFFNLKQCSSAEVDLNELRCSSKEQADIHRTELVISEHKCLVHEILHARSNHMQNDKDNDNPQCIEVTEVFQLGARVDKVLQKAERMFDTLLDSESHSYLSIRLAHLMHMSDLFCQRKDRIAALYCLHRAEPIVLKLIEWSSDLVNPRAVSYFLACYMRASSLTEARRVVIEIMEIISKRDDFTALDKLKTESVWMKEIVDARLDEASLLDFDQLTYAKTYDPSKEFSGLDSAIDGYLYLINKTNTA
jgi:hypothetical protein